ncbi:MAG: tetratricopeptide repeat protein [Flavobacteriales bacterium]|nr:tetratricopeptide repeat protein [Flavobacteriales bacterium]
MLRHLLMLLSIAPWLHTTAIAQINFDSLWTVWNDTLRDPVDRLRAMSYISIDGYLHNKPDSGYLLAVMQYDLAAKVGNERYQGLALNTQGEYFGMKGDFPRMLNCFERSREFFERGQDTVALAKILGNMGVLLQQLKAWDKAAEYYERSARMARIARDTASMAAAAINIGSLRMDQGDTARAMVAFDEAVRYRHSGLGDRDLSIVLGNMGIVHSRAGRYKLADSLHTWSLALAEGLEEDDLRIMALKNIGGHYLRMGDRERAIHFGDRALELCRSAGLPKETSETADLLYLAHKGEGRTKEALAMFELSVQMKDSLRNAEGEQELQRFTFEKKALADSLESAAQVAQLENERTIAELRSERIRNRSWAAGAGGVLLLGGIAAWSYTDRKRRKERFEKEAATLETQALRSQMNPHFIFNALNSVNAYVQENDTANATSFLTKFARVMRSVLENSRHAEVPLQEDLDTLRGYIDLERKRMQDKFDYRVEVDPAIDPQEVMVPPLVVQPFVENAIWHGMASKEGKGHILLKVEQRGQQLVWTIEDDGAGRHAKKIAPADGTPTKKTSLGTTITRARLDLVRKQYGGNAGFHYTDLPQGTRVEVEMPLMRA